MGLLLGAILSFASGGTASAAPQKTDCRAYNKATLYVVCVDISAQLGSIRSASNGVIGPKVVQTFVVTTSRVDDDGPNERGDTITGQGQFVAHSPQAKTGDGLKNFIGFGPGGQGIHSYKSSEVGPGNDSHGCVRVYSDVSAQVRKLLVTGKQGNLVDVGLVEFHIYP